ncbi:MarR family winged helix-turn-helix transcriptional regulator [Streptomyces sp. NPDC001177]
MSHALFRVARLHRMLAGQLLRETGLHPGQEMLMMYLWETNSQRQVDLARVLDADPATVTRMVRRLEKAGFVRRVPHPDDKRSTTVEPTVASQALRGKVEDMWRRLEELTLDGCEKGEAQLLLHLLEQVERNLIRATADGPPSRA